VLINTQKTSFFDEGGRMEMFTFRKGFRFDCWGLALLLGLFFIACFFNLSSAADYPTKPIQMIVPFPPGGGSDTAARIVSDKVSERLGQPVVVVNKPGAGGVLGVYAALGAPPDGYTIFVCSPAAVGAPIVRKGVTFNIIKDFRAINLAVNSPYLIFVRKDSPWLTFEDLISEAKKNPGKLTYSSSGYGGTNHFAGELLKMYAKVEFTHVPMEGDSPALTAVLGRHIDFNPGQYSSSYKFLKAGSIKGLLVMAKKRLPDFPDIPTTIEKGLPFTIGAWQAFLVRSETPQEIVDKLEKVFKEALSDEKVIELFRNTGSDVENLIGADAAKVITDEYNMRSEVAKKANIVPK
jgi:tripartite-type tricarboxylate transporter receptor subunit TctC